MTRIVLNADLGESEPAVRTRALMRIIDLANIACGGHAGSVATMQWAVSEAVKNKVQIGAHPGLIDREGFGRSNHSVEPDQLKFLLVSQISTLATIARSQGTKLQHVKLHGALYHAVETHPILASTYLTVMAEFFPTLRVIARIGGEVEKIAHALGIRVLREAFADRRYDSHGKLVPRDQPGALMTKVSEVKNQVRELCASGVPGDGGKPDTICVHGDTPDALVLARATRSVLNVF